MTDSVFSGNYSPVQPPPSDDTSPSVIPKPFAGSYIPIERPLTNREASLRAELDDAEGRTGMLGAAASGIESTFGLLKSTGSALLGDTKAIERQAREQREIDKTPNEEAFYAAFKEAEKAHGDELRNPLRAAWKEPVGALHAMIGQLPNSGAVLSGMYAGGATGAAVAGPVGMIAGGILGMYLGNAAIETGGIAQGKADDDTVTDEEINESLRQSLIKSGVITTVDTLAMGFNRLLMGAPGKAVEKAINQTLKKAGVDVANKTAVVKALADPKIARAAVDAGTMAITKATGAGGQIARGLAEVSVESAAEGVGEYGGSVAAGLPASKGEAAMEAAMSIPQSLIDIRVSKGLTAPGVNTKAVADAAKQFKGNYAPAADPEVDDLIGQPTIEEDDTDPNEIPVEPVDLAPAPPDTTRSPTAAAAEELATAMRPAPPASNVETGTIPIQTVEAAPPPTEPPAAPPAGPTANIDVTEMDVEDIIAAPPPMARLLPPPARTGVYEVSPPGVARELTTAELQKATPEERQDLVRLPTEFLKGIDRRSDTARAAQQQKPMPRAKQLAAPPVDRPEPVKLYAPAQLPQDDAGDTEFVLPNVVQKARAEAPAPEAKLPKKFTDKRLLRPTYRNGLQALAGELIEDGGGMQLVGGGFTQSDLPVDKRDKETRLPSLNPPWFQSMAAAEKISVKQLRGAVKVALAGNPLGVRQKRVIEGMLDDIEERLAQSEEVEAAWLDEEWGKRAREAETESPTNDEAAAITDIMARARKTLDEDALEALTERVAKQYEQAGAEEYNEALSREIERALNEQAEDRPVDAGAAEESTAVGRESRDEVRRGQEKAQAEAEALLTPYTAADLQERENQKAEGARKRAAAEQKVEADDEVDSFVLAGSDTEADQAAARGQQDLLSQPPTPLAPQFQTGPGELYSNGDKARYTGKTETHAGKTFYEIEMLEGADKGKTKLSAKKPAERIEDFGETLEGARKHYAAAYAEQMKEAGELDIASAPLSKTWPEPDYAKLLEGGTDPWIVGFVRAARDEIPTKPKKRYKLARYVAQVEGLRGFANDLLDGTITKQRLLEALDAEEFARLKEDLGGRVELYLAVGHGQSLKGIRVKKGSYSLLDGVKHDPPKIIWSVEKQARSTAFSNWPTQLAKGDTREEAIAEFKKAVESGGLETKDAGKVTRFDIYSKRGEKGKFFIGKKIGKDYVDLKEFDDVKAARAYRAEHMDELEQMLAKFKDVPNERRDTNSPRVGVDHRNGAGITPEQFAEAFGFRGGQFGTTLLKRQDEAQQNLNEAYDALMDLAGVLGLPPRALSLNGELGLAFGARGHGGKLAPAAHYEPGDKVAAGNVVINLTRKRGAGSLAHEWFHAVDNYFARMRGEKGDRSGGAYLTERAHRPGVGVRLEMVEAFKAIHGAVMNSALRQRSRNLDRTRTKEYWSTGREMAARAFESYVIEKLRDQEASNDYLANIVSPEYWKAATALGLEKEGTYPYPEAAEIPAIRAAFDQFFTTVEARETDRGVGLFARRSAQPFYSAALRAVETATQKKALPQQWEAYLKKSGVKQEEIDWLGLKAEFAKGKPLTQNELADFIRAHQVTVEEVLNEQNIAPFEWVGEYDVETMELYVDTDDNGNKITEHVPVRRYSFIGPDGEATDIGNVIEHEDGTFEVEIEGGEKGEIVQSLEVAEADLKAASESLYHDLIDDEHDDDTRHGEYQLPGGENYRELLITLPVKRLTSPYTYSAMKVEGSVDPNESWRVQNDQTEEYLGPRMSQKNAEQEAATRTKEMARSSRLPLAPGQTPFQSTHFDEPNILAHIRFNERADANGKRVLFIEEIQSDWHQKGRDEGYQGDAPSLPEGITLKRDADGSLTAISRNGDVVEEWHPSVTEEEATRQLAGQITGTGEGVPNAPFKKSWPLLAFKHALRFAAENGFDRVAWTTGTQQAERYRQQIERIQSVSWEPQEAPFAPKLVTAFVDRANGITMHVTDEGVVQSASMDRLEGKRIEDVLGKDIAKRVMGEESGSLKGTDIVIGGHAMRKFYDDMLPNMVNKYVKKWGARVGSITIGTPTPSPAAKAAGIGGNDTAAHALDITDAMRASVMQGQPLFSRRPLSELKWEEVIETANGPTFIGREITLFPATDPYTGKIPGGVSYVIVDTETGGSIGAAIVPVDDGVVTGIHLIRADKPRRGAGTKMVRALLANADRLDITNIIDSSREFWDKMGAQSYDASNNAEITRASHTRATERSRVSSEADEQAAQPATGSQESDGARPRQAVTQGRHIERIRAYLETKVGKLALKRLLDSGKFKILYSTDAGVPREARMAMDAGDIVSGFHDAETETSYLFADYLTDGTHEGLDDAYAIFMHEVGVHHGMYNMLGEKLFDAVAAAVRDADPGSKLGKAAKKARDQVHSQTQKDQIDEEMIAWLVTERANHEIPLVKRIIAKIRAFLVRLGFTKAVSADALVELARGAAQRIAGGRSGAGLFARRAAGENGLQMPFTQAGRSNLADKIVYNFVDRFKDLADIQKSIGPIPEQEDAKLREQLFPGRARKRLDDLDDNHVRPLLEAISAAGFSMEEVGQFLHARHAKEANRVLMDRNPNRENNDALSGMTDADAAAIVAQYAGNAAMQDVARRVDAINADRLTALVNDGLLSPDEAQAWRNTYSKYVPLHRAEFTDDEGAETLPARGGGYHIAGKESKLRAGSTKEVDHEMIVAYVVAQHEASAIRGEKNLVGRTLLELVRNHPDPELWSIDEYERAPHLKNGEIVYRPDTRMHDNEIGVKVDGKLTRIVFNASNPRAARLVKELKNLAGREIPAFMRFAHVIMRYLSMINTSLSPEFVLSNFARDMQTAGYNLGDTDLDGLRGQILKDAIRHGISGMWNNLHHRHNTQWARYADEFERAGGMVGWIDHYDDIRERAMRLEREARVMRRGHVGRDAIRGLAEFVSSANGAIENAVRLSAFVHARRTGMSSPKAASLSKNLTVNFNQRGAQSHYLNLAYLFFNASVQGSARLIRAVKTSAKVRKMVAATVVAAVVLDILNRAIGGDDDDDRAHYDKIPDSIKDRNLVVFYGDGADKYVQIPLPWGYNIFHVMGQAIGRSAWHSSWNKLPGYSVADEAARLLGATMEAFNPMASGSVLQTIAPTLIDPAVQIGENKEWHGGPLAPEKNPFGPPQPNSQRFFRSVSAPSKAITESINELTGGNRLRPGWWDWSPEWLDMVWSSATGSAGKFILDTGDTAVKAIRGDEIEAGDIPFIRKVVGKEYRSADYELYFERKNDLDILANELRKMQGNERVEAKRRAGSKVKAIGLAKVTDKQLQSLRKLRRNLEDTKAPKEQINAVEDRINATMQRFNRQYDRVVH